MAKGIRLTCELAVAGLFVWKLRLDCHVTSALVVQKVVFTLSHRSVFPGVGFYGAACRSEGRLQQRGMFSRVTSYEGSTEWLGAGPV